MMDVIWQIQDHHLFGISVTLAAYALSSAIWNRLDKNAFFHPVLVSTLFVGALLIATDMPYESYFLQAEPLNLALGAIIVLLAVPFYRQMGVLRESAKPISCALVVGSVVALLSALAYSIAIGADQELIATIAPKSATTAVAVQLSERLGGIPSLTAVLVISTGIAGAVLGPPLLDAVAVTNPRARGFALGLAAHAIGTARAFQMSETAGVFASIGMILNALLMILLVPAVLGLVGA